MNHATLIFVLLLFLIPNGVNAQKTKKSPYEDYWIQEAKRERFEQKRDSAYALFQQKKLLASKSVYEDALSILPDDQEVIARIRDLNLLIEKEKEQSNIAKNETMASDSVPKPEEIVTEIAIQPEPISSDSVSKKDSVGIPPSPPAIEKPKAQAPAPKPPKQVEPKKSTPQTEELPASPAPASVEKPFKNSENYRKYLAQVYPVGWTEEFETDGKKKITKRILVKDGRGDEYMKVVHPYATYYFKNGVSISYGTWVAESEKPKSSGR